MKDQTKHSRKASYGYDPHILKLLEGLRRGTLSFGVACAILCEYKARGKPEERLDDLRKEVVAIVGRTFPEEGEGDDEISKAWTVLERKYFDGIPPLALLSADADRVKRYVFESAKLPEVRGASALLDDLNSQIPDLIKAHGGYCIYSGGGSAMAILPASGAETARDEVERLYPEETWTATISAECVPLPLANLLDIRAAYKELGRRLQTRKLQKLGLPYFELLPQTQRCAACEMRPAYSLYRRAPDNPPLCPSCQAKREHSDRTFMLREFARFLKAGHPQLYDEYFQYSTASPNSVYPPPDLSAIGQLSDGYIAVIYGDGDRVGEVLSGLSPLRKFKEFSFELWHLVHDVVFTTLAENLRPQPPEKLKPESRRLFENRYGKHAFYHPFEINTIGGDDIFLIAPASYGPRLALSLIKGFSNWEKRHLYTDGHWGLSLGLLICPDHFPVYFVYDLAEQLLKLAKMKMREEVRIRGAEARSYVDFLILKGVGVPGVSVDDLISIRYTRPANGGRLSLTMRPYPYTDFEKLCSLAREVREAFSRRQIHNLQAAIYKGERQATFDVLYQMTRMARGEGDEEGPLDVLDKFQSQFAPNLTVRGTPLFPWLYPEKGPYKATTAFLDLLELSEFMER